MNYDTFKEISKVMLWNWSKEHYKKIDFGLCSYFYVVLLDLIVHVKSCPLQIHLVVLHFAGLLTDPEGIRLFMK